MINRNTDIAKKLASQLDKEKTIKMTELPKLLAKNGIAALHSSDNLEIATFLRELGFKIEEGHSFIKIFDKFINEAKSVKNIIELTAEEAELKYPNYKKCPNFFKTGNYSKEGVKKRENWDKKDMIQVDSVIYHVKKLKESVNEAKNDISSKLEKFLDQFPDNTEHWGHATDELPSLYHWMTEFYNGQHEDTPGKHLKVVGRDNCKTPAEWNKKYKTAIREAFKKFSTEQKENLAIQFKHWLK